jgi:putative transcriptional regulator
MNLRGQLLIAGPKLWDPNFRRTVVLIGQHDEGGAVGVVLNRVADLSVSEAAPELAPLAVDDRLFLGGPVQPEAAVVIAEVGDPDRVEVVAFDSVGFLGREDPEDVGGIGRARVFAGYAGWGAGQLEAEIAEDGSWIVEPAVADDVFAPDPDRLWSRVVRRKGREYQMLATMPYDPSMN